VIEKKSVRFQPIEATTAHPLKVSAEDELASKVVQVEFDSLHTGPQYELGL